MSDLRHRVDRLADAGAEGIELTHPAMLPPHRDPGRRAVAAITAALLAATVGIAALLGQDGDTVRTAPGVPEPAGDALVVVTNGVRGDASTPGRPFDLVLRFRDATGDVVKASTWAVDRVPPASGFLTHLPAGRLWLEATLRAAEGNVSCTQEFTATAGDGVILRLEEGRLSTDMDPPAGDDVACAKVQSVEDWAHGRTSPSGVAYVGLTIWEAEARAGAEGLTTRVNAANGVDVEVTMDLRRDRLDLAIVGDVVVGARLGGEEPMADPPDLPQLG